ncbi:hypothetical protein HQ531_06130, partial [bacterium]|nr:hypothetical protein [bacterium]
MKLILLGNHIRMLQIFIPIIFVAICGCEPKQSEVRIAIMGDQTGTRDLDSAYSIMTVAAGQMVKHSPDLLVHVGDMTESRGRGSSQYATDFQTAVGIMESVGTPWYLTA